VRPDQLRVLSGPRAAIDAVRAGEIGHPERLAHAGRRVEQHDGATVAVRLA